MLHRLVDGGHSVVAIEHDLDVIAEADREKAKKVDLSWHEGRFVG